MDQIQQLFSHYNIFAAFGMTIAIAVVSAIGALIIGTIMAIFRVSPVPVLRLAGTAYVNTVRNTPLTLVVFFFAFGLYQLMGLRVIPSDDLHVQYFFWGAVGMSIYHAAFVAEALRSGVNTVPQGQAEAARAVGLTFWQSLTQVILPQAFRGAIAPLGNALIALTKNTTVLATIGVAEIAYTMKEMIEFSPDLLFAIFLVVALGFVVLTLPTGLLFTHLSRKLAVAR